MGNECLESALLTLPEAARLLGLRRGPAASTWWRWAREGFKVPGTGRRVRLRLSKLGGRNYVKRSDLQEFIDRCSAWPAPPDPAPLRDRGREPAEPADAEERAAIARAELRQIGRRK